MPKTGEFFMDTRGIADFKRALRETAGSVREMRPAFDDISRHALDRGLFAVRRQHRALS